MRIGKEVIRGGQQYYYTAKPGTAKPWKEITEWCVQNYGPDAENASSSYPDSRWYRNDIVQGGKLWFKDEQDLIMFLLRWS